MLYKIIYTDKEGNSKEEIYNIQEEKEILAIILDGSFIFKKYSVPDEYVEISKNKYEARRMGVSLYTIEVKKM